MLGSLLGRAPERLDFVVGGVQKAGTTALHEYLKQHPNITMPFGAKEQHFFDDEARFQSAPIDYRPLHAAFRLKRKSRVCGEITPIYLFWRAAIPRLRAYNPELKLIFILRDPIERAFSQWNMQQERGTGPSDFVRAMEEAPALHAAASAQGQSRKFSFVARGLYAEQIENVRAHFPDAQLLFVKYEEFRRDQQGCFNQVCNFLGVPHMEIKKRAAPHRTRSPRKLTAEERQRLLPLFREDIEQVQRLLGWDCSDWLS